MNHRSRLTLRIIAVCVLACAPAAAQQQPPPSLGPAVQDFLSEWLRGNPDKAAERYLSKFSTTRSQVLPQADDPRERSASASSLQRLSSELRRVRAEFWAGKPADNMSAPATIATMGDTMPAIRERKLDPQPLKSAEALAFPVRTWDELTFTGTVGPRHRALFEGATPAGEPPYWGVITRLRASDGKIVPFLLLWRAEGPSAQPASWKLVTLFPILSD